VWCVFATLAIVRYLPPPVREPVQEFVLASVGYDRERRNLRAAGIRTVNESNRSIDGSLPMIFHLDRGAASQEYYFDVERNQPIAFASFQKSESRLSKDPGCIDAEAPRQGSVIGFLSLQTPGERYAESFPVGFSPAGLRVVEEVDSAKWAAIPGTSERVQFQLYFSPDQSFERSQYFACQRLSVHVNMTFKKLTQREETQ
jgi:hypothetical protein